MAISLNAASCSTVRFMRREKVRGLHPPSTIGRARGRQVNPRFGRHGGSRMPSSPPLVLASASPRRRALLAQLGLRFDVTAARPRRDARGRERPPTPTSLRLAREKAEAVAGAVTRRLGAGRGHHRGARRSGAGQAGHPRRGAGDAPPPLRPHPRGPDRRWRWPAAGERAGGAHPVTFRALSRGAIAWYVGHRRAPGQGGRLRRPGHGRLPRRSASRAAPPTWWACRWWRRSRCSGGRRYLLPWERRHERRGRAAGRTVRARVRAAACARAGRPGSRSTLVAVSKLKPAALIREAYAAGAAGLRGELRAGAAGQGRGAGGLHRPALARHRPAADEQGEVRGPGRPRLPRAGPAGGGPGAVATARRALRSPCYVEVNVGGEATKSGVAACGARGVRWRRSARCRAWSWWG